MNSDSQRTGKVFGIGCPKTGTTSLGGCFRILGLRNATWNEELHMRALRGDIEPALRFAAEYDSFDDLPWCMLFMELDRRFPGSKFVLTLRSDPAKWLQSFRAHHANVLGQLLDAEGRARDGCMLPVWPDGVRGYEQHNATVRAYFRDRPHDLLEICWERGDGWEAICRFLGLSVPNASIPHQNRTDPREARLTERLLELEERLPRGLRGVAKRFRPPLVKVLRYALGRNG